MDLTEDDFRNVSGQFSGEASIVEVRDAVNVSVETVKVDVSCILILLLMLEVANVCVTQTHQLGVQLIQKHFRIDMEFEHFS